MPDFVDLFYFSVDIEFLWPYHRDGQFHLIRCVVISFRHGRWICFLDRRDARNSNFRTSAWAGPRRLVSIASFRLSIGCSSFFLSLGLLLMLIIVVHFALSHRNWKFSCGCSSAGNWMRNTKKKLQGLRGSLVNQCLLTYLWLLILHGALVFCIANLSSLNTKRIISWYGDNTSIKALK